MNVGENKSLGYEKNSYQESQERKVENLKRQERSIEETLETQEQSILFAWFQDNVKGCLLLISCFFMVGVTHGQNDYHGDRLGDLLQQNEVRSMAKDATIDDYFLPYDSLQLNGSCYNFEEAPKDKYVNPVGLEFYLQKRLPTQLCFNPQTSVVVLKPMEIGNYKVCGIILTVEQAQMHCKNFVINETDAYERAKLDEYIETMFDEGHLQTTKDFKKKGEDLRPYIIYVMINESGEQFYISAYDFDDTRTSRVDVVLSNSYYELVGKKIAILSDQKSFTDIMTGDEIPNMNPLMDGPYKKSGDAFFSSGVKYDGIIMVHFRGLEDDVQKRLTYSFPNIKYCTCTDVFSEEGINYGKFEYEGRSFVLELNGKVQEKVGYQVTRSNATINTVLTYYKGGSVYLMTRGAIEQVQNEFSNTVGSQDISFKQLWKKATSGSKKHAKERQATLQTEVLQQETERTKLERQWKEQLVQKYGIELSTQIMNKMVVLGMTTEMCQEAWGTPFDTCKTSSLETTTVWIYGYKTYLYFVDNQLVRIQNL